MWARTLTLRGSTTLRIFAASFVVALTCAVLSVYSVSLLPPGLEKRHVEIGVASSQVLLDATSSYVLNESAANTDFSALNYRAELFGHLMASPPLRGEIARRMGLGVEDVAVLPRITQGVPDGLVEPDSELRATQILLSHRRYRLDVQSDPTRPILNLYAQGPTPAAAARLADVAVLALSKHVDELQRDTIDPRSHIRLDQLGPARAGPANPQTEKQIVLLTFLAAFAISLGLLFGALSVRRGWLAARESGARPAPAREPAPPGEPAPARAAQPWQATSDWPHTTRILPWIVAGLMVIVWLVPFNTIELTASLPFDLKLDRLVLPIAFGVWILAIAVGAAPPPRLRSSPIHAAIGAFGAVVCAGVLLDALYLNQTLELELAIKKLSLLFAYGGFFVLVASIVRPTEVPAFLKYTLALAAITAAGTIWEHRFHYNVFYSVSDTLLPSFFTVGAAESGLVEASGRSLTRGPGEHPLEAVAMLAMGLPIALVGIIGAKRPRATVIYSIAACLMLAASLSTNRKTALLAPLAVCLVIAYFRRRELLKLAPLGALAVFAVHLLSPGAIGSVLFQLKPDQLGVGTVSDRASDYDAIRPDLWTHLGFGRGYGTYDHVSYRILDSEILSRLVDSGLLGVSFLVIMLLSIVLSARGLIRARHPVWSSSALAVAAAAVGFFVMTFLFDVSSFPHAPYILMSLAAMLSVMVADRAGAPTGAPTELSARREPPAAEEQAAEQPPPLVLAGR